MSGYHYGRNITPCNLHLDKGKITCDCGRVVVLSKILAYFERQGWKPKNGIETHG